MADLHVGSTGIYDNICYMGSDIAVSLEVKCDKATVRIYPSPSWTVTQNLQENLVITSAHGGSKNQTMNGVKTMRASSIAKVIAFIAKSSPKCMCTVFECDSSHHSSGRKCKC